MTKITISLTEQEFALLSAAAADAGFADVASFAVFALCHAQCSGA